MSHLTRNLPLIILAVVVLDEGVLAWKQGRELADLRALSSARARLAGRLAAAGRQEHALQIRAAGHGATAGDALGANSSTQSRSAARINFNANFKAALDNPKFRQALAISQKASLNQFYGPLFRGLNLPPDRLDRLKNLMVEAQMAKTDSLYAAADQGLAPGTSANEHYEATAAAQKETYDQIHSLLGDAGFDQFQQYQQTRFLHLAVAQVQQSLSYTATPLSDDQANQLVNSFYQAMPPAQRPDATGYMAQVGSGIGDPAGTYLSRPIPEAGLATAENIVSAPQMQVLLQLQQAQQAQLKLRQLWLAAHPPPAP